MGVWEVVVAAIGVFVATLIPVSVGYWKLAGDKGKTETRVAHLEKDYESLKEDFTTLHKRIDSRESEIKELAVEIKLLREENNKQGRDIQEKLHCLELQIEKKLKVA